MWMKMDIILKRTHDRPWVTRRGGLRRGEVARMNENKCPHPDPHTPASVPAADCPSWDSFLWLPDQPWHKDERSDRRFSSRKDTFRGKGRNADFIRWLIPGQSRGDTAGILIWSLLRGDGEGGGERGQGARAPPLILSLSSSVSWNVPCLGVLFYRYTSPPAIWPQPTAKSEENGPHGAGKRLWAGWPSAGKGATGSWVPPLHCGPRDPPWWWIPGARSPNKGTFLCGLRMKRPHKLQKVIPKR